MRYYEALDKNHEIIRFWAKDNREATTKARVMRFRSVVRVAQRSLKILETVLPYKDSGYR